MPSYKPLVSVVVLNRDGKDFLLQTLPAIFGLAYSEVEVIVVDNGSVDGSVEYLEGWANRIRLIKNTKNLGYSKGKNMGVSAAVGEYVLLLDNDIQILDRDILGSMIVAMKPDAGLVQLPLLDKGESTTYHYGIYFGFYGPKHDRKKVRIASILGLSNDMVAIPAATGAALFFRKRVWLDIGGFDESQAFNIDDIDIGPRAWILGYRNYLYTRTYAMHLGINKTPTADTYSARYKTMFSGHARSIIKNYAPLSLFKTLPLLCAFHLVKSIKFSIKLKSVKVFLSFLDSVACFLACLPGTLKERHRIQSNRKVAIDAFVFVSPPKFE